MNRQSVFPRRTAEARRERGLLNRRRFQLAGALVVGAILPWFARGPLLPGTLSEAASINTLAANMLAIALAFWLRLTIETYPGIRRSAVILPATLGGHGATIAFLLLSRLPYDRVGLIAGFLLHMAWLYLLYVYAERNLRRTVGVVPFGRVDQLRHIDTINWRPLRRPSLKEVRKCDALVADFSADLPDEWERFLADAALDGRIVYQVKQLWESLTGKVQIDHLSENSFGSLLPARGYFYAKGLIDFLFALLVLPLTLVAMALIALAIRVDTAGPIFFRQTRIGHAGRPMTIYKFRTMVPISSDDARKDAMTSDDDDRVTTVGRFLRKLRIDELPQIFNILKWEMSWIGPRPEAEVLSVWYTGEIPFYRYRHVVKPGISGWAQVNQGHVAEVDQVIEKLQYDFYYIKYFSPWLDVLIVFRTIKTMLSGFGAR